MFEGWSQDVSHDVAQELRRRCDLHGRDVPSDLQDFVDRHDAVDRSQLSLPMRLVCTMACDLCEDCGWVCEEHPGRPWEGPHACTCGAAGAPCPRCNVPTEGEVPRMPDGFEIEVDEERWRQPSGHFRP
jgi:hypothetical protein